MDVSGLSYRDTDQSAAGPNFHPLIQQKRLVTGQRKEDMPQVVRGMRRGESAGCWPARTNGTCHACHGVAFRHGMAWHGMLRHAMGWHAHEFQNGMTFRMA